MVMDCPHDEIWVLAWIAGAVGESSDITITAIEAKRMAVTALISVRMFW
jgi:hypothetical protein